jgi:probable LLM family oxidoreductase
MQIGIDSFAAVVSDPKTGKTTPPAERIRNLIEEIELADQVGLDSFGVGEHHRPEYLDSAPVVILAGAATRTKKIRLNSAVTVLSAADPVRVFQSFSTLDLLSNGRAEMVVGRGSFTEAYPLFGLELEDYDDLFEQKLDLLLALRKEEHVHWEGRHRPPLSGQGVYPRPVQETLPVWIGVGGTPESFVRAGLLGLPLMVAIIGGQPARFRSLIELYRHAGAKAGYKPEQLKVGAHLFGFVGDTTQQAADDFYPGYERMFTKIGAERGWGRVSRAQFDATMGDEGAYLIGDPKRVAEKLLHVNESLGGLDRVTFQMTNVLLPHTKMKHAIELLGTEVAPRVRRETAAKASVS